MILWLAQAQKDLDAELRRIAAEDEYAAKRVAVVVKSSTELLGQFPEGGRPGRISGTRELVVSGLPYILPYRIRGGRVEILRFFHTAQKPPQSW